jgi:hypothetical protein
MSQENLFKILSNLLFDTFPNELRYGSVIHMLGGIHSCVSLKDMRRESSCVLWCFGVETVLDKAASRF